MSIHKQELLNLACVAADVTQKKTPYDIILKVENSNTHMLKIKNIFHC